MKKVLLLSFLVITTMMSGQNAEKRPDAGVFLPQVGLNIGQFSADTTPTQNVVFIEQAGIANFTQINSSGLNAISVLQEGDNNFVSIDTGNVSLVESIVQRGSNNSITASYGTYNSAPVNSQIMQEGVGLSVLRIGTNSITENLKINMEGSGREVIIRSYK
ncbi:hypothetical protein [Spongiivirga sp. MCCC 1A20706]|uniref:hypothetical protein n=1 Tax=Spongiivirga sp. MCCC 1A20706 TaxID=3160963 RepID=UPI0039778F49